jgi:hypothetical protein
VSVQAQEEMPELVREHSAESTREDFVRDVGEHAAIPIAVDGSSDLLGPEGDALCLEARVAQAMVVPVTATAVDDEAGRTRLQHDVDGRVGGGCTG